MRSYKKAAVLTAAALTFASFAGCSFGSSADSLLTPVMISEKQEKVYNALVGAVGDNISLVYPKTGAYRSAFIFADMDADGTEEAVAFYEHHSETEGSVRVNILDCDEAGVWYSSYDHAGAGNSVEQVYFSYLGGVGIMRMAIGYGNITGTDNVLKIYSYDGKKLDTEYTENYYRLVFSDLDNDGGGDIVLINCNTENHGAYVSLVTDRGSGADSVAAADLRDSTIDISSVTGGFIGNSTPAVFVDGLSSNGMLSTEIVYCVNGNLRNPANLPGSRIPADTTRQQGLFCRDIDGDGIVEIPAREAFPGYRDSGDMHYITDWGVFEDYSVTKKHSSFTDSDSGYCFMIPVRWEGRVTVKTDNITGETVFYKFNTNLNESRLELMRVRPCSISDTEGLALQGYFAALVSDNAAYMVKLGDTDDSLLLTQSEVRNNFCLYK